MNRTLAWAIALSALLASGGTAASPQDHRQPPPGVQVPAWNQLSPYQREKLRHLAQDWDHMPASRRVWVLERLERARRWEAMTPRQREAMREGARHFQGMPPELRARMRRSIEKVQTLPVDQQRALREQWRRLDPQQRRRWLEAGGPGYAPPPEA